MTDQYGYRCHWSGGRCRQRSPLAIVGHAGSHDSSARRGCFERLRWRSVAILSGQPRHG